VAQERNKALRYRRAVFPKPDKKTPVVKSLESYLDEAHKQFTTVSTRRVELDGSFVLEIRHARKRKDVGSLMHLAAYTKEEPASVVPRAGATDDDAPVTTAPPPRGADYMDGDLHLLVSGNDVVLCASSLHEHKFEQYCALIFEKAGLPPVAAMFQLETVADTDKLAVIENEGVKEIVLNTIAFAATAEHVSRHSIRKTIGKHLMGTFRALFRDDPDLSEISESENLSAQLVIKFDRRKTGGELSQQRLESLAKRLVQDDSDDGFKIRTLQKTTLGYNDVSLQKPVKIRADGKTVQRDAAFRELVTYYQELRNEGHLER
jgi:hypothetical protein